MSKVANPNASKDSRKVKKSGHGTYRCKRKPNSKRCK